MNKLSLAIALTVIALGPKPLRALEMPKASVKLKLRVAAALLPCDAASDPSACPSFKLPAENKEIALYEGPPEHPEWMLGTSHIFISKNIDAVIAVVQTTLPSGSRTYSVQLVLDGFESFGYSARADIKANSIENLQETQLTGSRIKLEGKTFTPVIAIGAPLNN